MSNKCIFTSKKTIIGNNRSHAMNATKRKFKPNIKKHKIWIEEENRYIKLRISAKAIKIIDKKGINFFIKKNYKIHI